MICLNSSTTAQERNNMYRLNFFSAADINSIEAALRSRFAHWASEHILVKDFSLSVSAVSINDVNIAQWDLCFFAESVITTAMQEGGCDWAAFVFGEQHALCPKDNYFPAIIEKIKQSLLSEVLSLDAKPAAYDKRKKLITGANTYYCIEIKGATFGVVKFLMHQSCFALFFEKPQKGKKVAGLSSRLSAVSSLKVSANIRFDFGIVPFDQLILLNSTRVLTSLNGVKNQFKMSINGVDVCNVAVGKKVDRKAFLILKEQSV